MTRKLSIFEEQWELKKPFVISRSSRTKTATITVSIKDGMHIGLGESVPNPRYGESISSSIEQIKMIEQKLTDGLDRGQLNEIMPAGAARNAVDCALWDLEAKQLGENVGAISGLGWPGECKTVQTISILSPQEMYEEAKALANFASIKVKLNAEQVLERIEAVHSGAPGSNILIDANESWTIELLNHVAPALAKLNVVMIEQPLHADKDEALIDYQFALPLFADESCHSMADLPNLQNKYQGINIKLDKTGGLTGAIKLEQIAHKQDMQTMVGCMLGTSLGIAPAMFLAERAQYVDIDAPALLAKDRDYGIEIDNGTVSGLNPRLWGGC